MQPSLGHACIFFYIPGTKGYGCGGPTPHWLLRPGIFQRPLGDMRKKWEEQSHRVPVSQPLLHYGSLCSTVPPPLVHLLLLRDRIRMQAIFNQIYSPPSLHYNLAFLTCVLYIINFKIVTSIFFYLITRISFLLLSVFAKTQPHSASHCTVLGMDLEGFTKS